MLRLGYNTNGFAHHRLEDAIEIIAELGYQSVAVTIERDLLDPPDRGGVSQAARRLTSALRGTALAATIETGGRFILDPRRKHQPTLLGADPWSRRRRIEFLRAAIDLAAETAAESVSLWSGAPDDDAREDELFSRMRQGLGEVLSHAETRGVRLSFEPEPGMLIDTMQRYARLHEELSHPLFGLTLDVGHVVCLGDGSPADHIAKWSKKLWNVHIEDMRAGVHEHLMFGEGDVDFAAVFAGLRAAKYAGPIHVELSRHSHDAVAIARRSFVFLKAVVSGSEDRAG